MTTTHAGFVHVLLAVLLALMCVPATAIAQDNGSAHSAAAKTGFAVKKPVVGAACPLCPWGAMADVVKKAAKPYGWDIQICYYCAGGPREARLVSRAAMATPPAHPSPDDLPTPDGPLDFGITNPEFLHRAYRGIASFARDPGKPQKQLRLIANIQLPSYYIVAVRADSGIRDLRDIAAKHLAVRMVATNIGGAVTPAILDYYGITGDKIKSFGGTFTTSYQRNDDYDVIMGFGALLNNPEYRLFYEASQKYNLRYLELAPALRSKLVRVYSLKEHDMPPGLLRGVDHAIPTVTKNGVVVYGRTDMPDQFAYDMARALDEHQDLLAWTHMNWSYNSHTVWKALDVPLHPGAARYYRERGYMH